MRWLLVALILAGIQVLGLLTVPGPRDPDRPGRTGGIRTAAAQLRGDGPPLDLVQDYVGARAIVDGGEAYPVLSEAYATVGLDWTVHHRSTHPPTAFVLALPVAWLPWPAAAAVWAAAMLAAIAAAFWAFGLSSEVALVAAPLSLFWPPAAWSLGQTTPLWLLGIALAWRFRDRPTAAGAAIGLASLTKFLPAIAMVPFLLLRRWSVLRGFAAVWAVVVSVVLLFDAGAITRYVDIARATEVEQAARGENAALFLAARHNYGILGLGVATVIVAVAVALSVTRIEATRSLDRWSWDVWTWAAVALLPIAWIYSLLPLIPSLARLVRARAVSAMLAAPAIVIPFFIDPFGLPGAILLALGTASMGVALLASR